MADGQELPFYQRRCHAQGCAAVFFICRSCYRGQRYCSEPCRQLARRQQRRAANRRHQQSPEGRLDHADRQREYRLRVAGRVTDQGSATEAGSGSISQLDPIQPRPTPGRVCCVVCGRRGRFIEQRE
jgi:hypothetical protein